MTAAARTLDYQRPPYADPRPPPDPAYGIVSVTIAAVLVLMALLSLVVGVGLLMAAMAVGLLALPAGIIAGAWGARRMAGRSTLAVVGLALNLVLALVEACAVLTVLRMPGV